MFQGTAKVAAANPKAHVNPPKCETSICIVQISLPSSPDTKVDKTAPPSAAH
jgi:hypothetical protein